MEMNWRKMVLYTKKINPTIYQVKYLDQVLSTMWIKSVLKVASNLPQSRVLKHASYVCSIIFHASLRRHVFVYDIATGGCHAILIPVSTGFII